ncbi:uncharacterized protein LOC109106607 isoform X1 [Cyprinus carpio]|uniref:Uncharacterized protein LOC109106607 isoform X1 n=1 Tax=Cyprinus carpio TaxID=7962 RepID=A0A9R0BC52_CYPCA|nr:uncharacterized protein LOC109106607 isoform X1 [Cyprinus carpio]
MGVVYSVGEVDHLYTFFVQWSPETIYSKHSSRQDFLRVHALSVIDSFLSHSASEQWELKCETRAERWTSEEEKHCINRLKVQNTLRKFSTGGATADQRESVNMRPLQQSIKILYYANKSEEPFVEVSLEEI